MFQLVESLKVKNGMIFNVEYHNKRCNLARKTLYGINEEVNLNNFIKPPENKDITYKCRVIYSEEIENVEFEEYKYRQIKSLKIVRNNEIDYTYKSTNRLILNQLFSKRENCDDIIIVKNGYVTDSSSANIVFWDGNRWITPSTPLLKGTQRALLLDKGIITESRVNEKDINLFQKIRLINAMLTWDIAPEISIRDVE